MKKKKEEKKNPKLVVLKLQGFALLLKKENLCENVSILVGTGNRGATLSLDRKKKCLGFSFFVERVLNRRTELIPF